ncbi:hypothetical protein EZV73_27440 [Acidaminobacter sp. JC074]|uniref:hypothetical protein n=1 Tax=Acidaminobacter sp. JC074 TaxID=2530199 RepID=UPI001F0D5DBF|nr:hypothetical protein [Acidaminobacter sp. JC074]MCH4891335.1 hypothetical protein [Acidaminobacter sp. JC074]
MKFDKKISCDDAVPTNRMLLVIRNSRQTRVDNKTYVDAIISYKLDPTETEFETNYQKLYFKFKDKQLIIGE